MTVAEAEPVELMTDLTPLESALQAYSDLHKDVYGFRPRGLNPAFLNTVELVYAEIDRLEEELKVVEAQRQEDERMAAVKFELRVQEVIATGARDRATALRWIMQADCAGYDDWDFLCYLNGLSYGYFKGEPR